MANMNAVAVGALATAFVGLIVVTVALSTDYWSESSFISTGLWRVCSAGVCTNFELDTLPDWLKATQAAVCLAFIANLAAVTTLALFAFVTSVTQKHTKIASLFLLGVAVFWNIIAVAVYGVEGIDLSWSWGMAIFAAILEVIALIVTVVSQQTD